MSKVKEEQEETNIEPAENTALAAPAGEIVIDVEDIDIPRLSVVQKMSSSEFDHGSLVLDKSHEIIPAQTKTPCIILGAVKKWKEDIPFESEEMPTIAETKAEAKILEENSDYPILEYAELMLMFPQPEGNEDDEAFPFPIGDTNYCVGKLYAQKDAYRKTYKALMTFAAFNRTATLGSRLWTFESQVMSKGKYSWFVPTLAPTTVEVSEEVNEFVSSFSM